MTCCLCLSLRLSARPSGLSRNPSDITWQPFTEYAACWVDLVTAANCHLTPLRLLAGTMLSSGGEIIHEAMSIFQNAVDLNAAGAPPQYRSPDMALETDPCRSAAVPQCRSPDMALETDPCRS